MKILILGGTGEAKQLAQQLLAIDELEITYSIAGLVRKPELNCEVVSAGFSQLGGLTKYLNEKKINAILDASHPFAQRISLQGIASAAEANIPYYSFVRQQWQAQAGDKWSLLETEEKLLDELALSINTGCKNIFYSTGQIDQKLALELDQIGELNESFAPTQYIVRSAKETALPLHAVGIQAIGPFNIEDEKDLLTKYEIDLIVCKNSGGNAAKAKLEAARELGIRVLMLQRPQLVSESASGINKLFNTLDECFEFISEKYSGDF